LWEGTNQCLHQLDRFEIVPPLLPGNLLESIDPEDVQKLTKLRYVLSFRNSDLSNDLIELKSMQLSGTWKPFASMNARCCDRVSKSDLFAIRWHICPLLASQSLLVSRLLQSLFMLVYAPTSPCHLCSGVHPLKNFPATLLSIIIQAP
jgi:hypothetical protein